ncbi:uncharacterized protein LOC119097646 [Pollicipes pollicipes]|uniref:uncharacterized protein LOC119097646 n=1 Tax=Pollicipes pollicipes TaxID=41117 RepID=UPI001884AC84|nr:uncharacterized protein LOC119097646 [Pollicipes pollicipes]XP_037076581.1 uncharacterized protein LOC119097646 [Pollicipes pollicipes]
MLPKERCICELDRELRWARQQLIDEIVRHEGASGPRVTTTTTTTTTTTPAAPVPTAETMASDGGTADVANNVTGVTEPVTNVTGGDPTTPLPPTSVAVAPRRRREAEASTSGPDSPADVSLSCGNTTDGLSNGSQPCGNGTDSYGNATDTTVATTTTEPPTPTTTTEATTTRRTTRARSTPRARPARTFPPGIMATGRGRRPRLSLCQCPNRAEGVFGTIRILNMHWRTVLLYPSSGVHRRATKYIHEQLDLVFRRSLGSWYATSEVLAMEEGSVVAHHKVYLTRKVDNITDLVQRSFTIGYRAGVTDMEVDSDSISYYFPPEPPTKPAIWYLRYLALVVAFGVLGGLTYDVCWRTNVCGVRAPYGTLEPEEQQGTKPSSAKSGLFYTVSTMVTTHALWAKTKAVAALQRVKKARSGDTDGLATQLECQLEDPVEEPQQGADSALPAEDEQEVAADGADGPLPAENEPRAEDEQEAEDEQRGAEGQRGAEEGDEVQREDDSAEQEGDGDQEEENSPQQEDDMAQQEENDDAQREEGAPHEVAEPEA